MSAVSYETITNNLKDVIEEILEDMDVDVDITITKQSTPTSGSVATYVVKKNGTALSPKIEIPLGIEVVGSLDAIANPKSNVLYIVVEV